MFEVSEEFKNAVGQNTRRYTWTGTITTTNGKEYSFGPEDMVKGSGYIKWQCCGSTEIELGTVYAAELAITLYTDIDRYTLPNGIIKIYYTLELADGSTETIPMGVYEISEAGRGISTVEITAYDYMVRFDEDLSLTSSTGTAYQFIKASCDACGVEMAQDVSEISEMPNGTLTLSIYSDNDIGTYRDLLYYVAQVLGGFCQIDRYGRLVIKQYESESVLTVKREQRFDSTYSDYVTRYTAVRSTNLTDSTSEYVSVDPDDGLTMALGSNPLMQFGLKTTRESILMEILTALQKVQYVPFESTTIGNPALEPGDVLRFSGGHADEEGISCITDIEYKIGGRMSIKCVGKNPRLAGAKSKNEKNIAGLLNSVQSGKTVVYSFTNVAEFEIGSTLTDVMDIDFTAVEDTTAAFYCEMLLEIIKSDDGEDYPTLSIVYKINDDTVEGFMPKQVCLPGKHIITLFYPLSSIVESSSNTFSMYLMMTDGTASIGAQQIKATISGQGLAAGLGDWNGRISITENIGGLSIESEGYDVEAFGSEVNVSFPVHENPGITQVFSSISISESSFGMDSFTDRSWITEILKMFVMTVVRGRPVYGDYITVNTEDAFILLKDYILYSEEYAFEEVSSEDTGSDETKNEESETGGTETSELEVGESETEEQSIDDSSESGYAEVLSIDTSFLESLSSLSLETESTGEFKLLIQDEEGAIYTIEEQTDDESGETGYVLVELAETEITAELFSLSGADVLPDWELISSLSTPRVYTWSETESVPVKAIITGAPPKQYVMTTADLSDETVLGIDSLEAEYDGDVTVQYSFDGEAYTEETAMEDFLLTDTEAMYAGLTESMQITFRFWLSGDASLTSFTMNYRNGDE